LDCGLQALAALSHTGQVLERINGKSCSKVISQKSFNDVWYIRSMLKQTFVALDAAQRAYGYVLRVVWSHAAIFSHAIVGCFSAVITAQHAEDDRSNACVLVS
jgi:hypothetical protein